MNESTFIIIFLLSLVGCNSNKKQDATHKTRAIDSIYEDNSGAMQKVPRSKNTTDTIILAQIDSLSIKEIKWFVKDELSTIYEYYKKEEVNEVEIWSNKMFGRCYSEADLEYSELLEFEINATTTNHKYPSNNLSDKAYRTAYVF